MPSERQSGFTLIELMVTIAVLAVLLAIGLPSFQSSLRSNRVATTTNELLASLSLARTEAIRGIGPAGVCPSADGVSCTNTPDWAGGWVVWREDRAAGGVTVRTVVRYTQALSKMAITGPADGIEFTVQGRRSVNTAVNIALSPDGVDTPARCLSVTAAGQTKVAGEACA